MLSGKVWPELANCKSGDPDALFVNGAEQNTAKRICRGCPVKYECLADALDNRIEFGVWGGMTERERRALLRRHPVVSSWRAVLASKANEQHAETARLAAIRKLAQPMGEVASDVEPPKLETAPPATLAEVVEPNPEVLATTTQRGGAFEPTSEFMFLPVDDNPVV